MCAKDSVEEVSGAKDPAEEVILVVTNSQKFVEKFETAETKGLSLDQLQRIVLLQQMKVLSLQKTKLENDVAMTINPTLFDSSTFSQILNENEN